MGYAAQAQAANAARQAKFAAPAPPSRPKTPKPATSPAPTGAPVPPGGPSAGAPSVPAMPVTAPVPPQPDASGVVPPPNTTPSSAGWQTELAASGAPLTESAYGAAPATPMAATAKAPVTVKTAETPGQTAPVTAAPTPAPPQTAETQGVNQYVPYDNSKEVAAMVAAVPMKGKARVAAQAERQKPPEGFFAPPAPGEARTDYSWMVGPSGTLDYFPTDINKFLNDSKMDVQSPAISNYMRLMKKALDNYPQANDPNYSAKAAVYQHQINTFGKVLRANGWNFDINALMGHAGQTPPSQAPTPPPPTPPVDPGTITPPADTGTGTGADGSGVRDITIPSADPNAPASDFWAADWGNETDVERRKAYLAWLASQQADAMRQQAVDEAGNLVGDYTKSPEYLAQGAIIDRGMVPTYTAADLEKMKTADRETYGNAMSELDRQMRERAAGMGLQSSDLASEMAAGRAAGARDLYAAERNIDLTGAQQAAQDRDNWTRQLMALSSSRQSPLLDLQKSRLGLIAGTPGLIQAGNPYAGITGYQDQGLSSLARLAQYGQLAGTGMSVLGNLGSGLAAAGV